MVPTIPVRVRLAPCHSNSAGFLEAARVDCQQGATRKLNPFMGFLLEIAVESVDAAIAAERAAADRIELCASLSAGGLTPSPETMRQARAFLRIPIFAMIRPRAGDFLYSDEEFTMMQNEIAVAREIGLNGVVLGPLTTAKTIDVARSAKLVALARPLPVTFHRAFDETPNLLKALEDVIATGATRILTSGGTSAAPQALDQIRELVQAAGQRIIVMPGAGIHAGNFPQVRQATYATEFHSGLGSVLPYGSNDFSRFEVEIRQIVAQKIRPV
jgi:copper homeostasis protein